MAYKLMRLVVLCLIPLSSYSQIDKTFYIGDTMPPLTFCKIFNNPGSLISLENYRGKLIILDFWNKWCPSCIQGFPKMEKLQQEFGDRIKILLVTNDTDKDLIRLFKKTKLPALPIISNDSILCRMFPHTTVPHHVWINPDGRIQFITDGYNATSQNISKVLDGKNVKLKEKKEAMDVDKDSDLFKEGKGRLQKFISSYSFAMTKLEGIIDDTYYNYTVDTINKICGFKFVNVPILDLYKIAFGKSIAFAGTEFAYNNRILFKIPGGDKNFRYPDNTDSIPGWKEKNLVSYESKWKLNNDSLAYEDLKNDANKFFSFSVTVDTVEVRCFVLKKINSLSDTKLIHSTNLINYTDSSYSMKNMPISVLLKSLNGWEPFKETPLVDETNSTSNIDVELHNAFTDIVKLKGQLLKYGLQLTESSRKLRMLIIRSK